MFELRPYQSKAIETTYSYLADKHRPIICAYCGAGKTVIAAQLAKDAIDQGKRVIWMTGREEIIRQAHRTFADVCGMRNVGVLCAGLERETPFWFYPPVTIASWDTLKARWNKSDAWHIPADLVMYDEAHLALSQKMTETIIPHYADKTVVGLTATPARKSGKGLGSHFTKIIQVRKVQDLMDDGYLAHVEYWAGKAADLSSVSVDAKTGDYQQKQLGAAHRDGVLIGDVIDNWLRLASECHTIVFAVDIAHAQALTERFQSAGIEAGVIHSKMTHPTRTGVSEQFRDQRIQVMVNVGVTLYGYDVPSCNCVVLARPTKSIVLHHQMIGRVVRPKPDGGIGKVLDNADNVRRLGCIEDVIRWRLKEGSLAAVNTTREGDATRNQAPEPPPNECGQCHYVFSRSRVCPKCGWEKPAAARDIEVLPADLVQVRKPKSEAKSDDIDPITWFRMALGWCDQHGKKRGYACHRFREKFKVDQVPKDWRALEPNVRVDAYMRAGLIRFAKSRARA